MQDRTTARYFLLALLLAVGVVAYYILQPFLTPLALAAIFAVVLQPVYMRALKNLHGSETLASLMTVLVFLVILLVPVAFFGERLFSESQQLYRLVSSGVLPTDMTAFVQERGAFLDAYIPNASQKLVEATANFSQYANDGLSWLVQHLGVAFSSVSAFFLGFFIFLMSLYYLLRDGGRLCRYLVRLSPLPDTDDELILRRLTVAVNSVVKGKILIALAQGLFAGVGLFVFGVPNAILWTLVATVAALIPPFGTGLITLPAAIYLFFVSPAAAIGMLIWGVIGSVIDNIFGPKLMSRGTSQHPLVMLLAVLGGIAVFGPVGVFLGPLVLSLFLTLLDVHLDVPRT